MKKLTGSKVRFIKEYGYFSYRKIYYMCKYFEMDMDILLSKSKDQIEKLLK